MLPDLPFELLIPGVPISHQTKRSGSLERWKAFVRETARRALPEGHFALQGPLDVTIYFFPQAPLGADLDNCAKPILDGMGHCVYVEDSQIERLVLQRFVPGRPLPVGEVTEVLEVALASSEPVIYIRIDAVDGEAP